jgi:hypothetical protein
MFSVFIIFQNPKSSGIYVGPVVCEPYLTRILDPTCSDGPFNNNEVIYRRSTDNGVSFSDIINSSNSIRDSISPDIASTNDGIIYVVWTDNASILLLKAAHHAPIILSLNMD